jgi:hypothetical protein
MREIPVQQYWQGNKGGQDNRQCECSAPKFITSTVHMLFLSGHTQRDPICALELLRKAFDDIGHLIDGVAKLAHWWSKAEGVISTFEKQILIDGRRISLLQLDKARNGWESVRDRYEVYSRVVSAPQ